MLIDVEKLSPETPLRADLCIVGGGAAGLALCYALRSTPCSIIVVDSGDMNNDQESRKFLAGSNIGQHPFNLGGQRRRLGGGMNDWGGNCSLLDPDDFTSGNIHTPQWPLSFSELARHSSQVEAFLRLDTRFSAGALAATSQAAHVTLPSPPGGEKNMAFSRKHFCVAM
jgi:choline dehydrogenase-like flavoprotein